MDKPKVSEARRRANDKWDKENMTILGCKVKKTEAADFKNYAVEQGKTPNALLKGYVMDCLSNREQDNADK